MRFAPSTSELTFTCDGNRLVGDLTRPARPGPYPLVVFVEGSGPGGRDLGDWPLRLAAAGFASLAYDKPGSGASTGDWTAQTLDDRARETLAAVTAAAVDGQPVALIGGSQGGWVAHLAAAASPAITAVVTVSGPGVGVLTQEEHRLRHQIPAAGHSPDAAVTAVGLLRDQIARARAGDDPARIHAAQAHWSAEPWYPLLAGTTPETIAFLARIADHDPLPVIRALRCPLLAIFGEDDVQVPVADSVTALASAGARTVVFPGAGHDLRRPDGTRPPGFDELVVTWLHQHLR